MQLANFFTAALLAIGVVAIPSFNDDKTADIEVRTHNKCKLGEIYNAHWKTCACPPGQQYLEYKCRYPALKEPDCLAKDAKGNKEHKYCSKSDKKWSLYHKNFAYCEDDGINIAWCSSITDFKYNLAQKYNDKLPVCKDKQEYNAWTKKCECPKGFNWKDNEQQCKYPVVEKPKCINKPTWCGKAKSKYCKFDSKAAFCEQDGSSWSFCADENDVKSFANTEFDE